MKEEDELIIEVDILNKGYNNCYSGFKFLVNGLEYNEVTFNNKLIQTNSANGKLEFTIPNTKGKLIIK
jgi:hypothetical protein